MSVKIRTLVVALTVQLLFYSSLTFAAWTPGNFEIYVLDNEQADSQLIISPTGQTLLIDAGERSWNSGAQAQIIANKLRAIMGPSFTTIDYFVASHLHLDHIGYVGYGGLWALIERHGFTVGKIIDRNSGNWSDSNLDSACDPNTEIVWKNAGTVSGTARNWLCYVNNPANAGKINREVAQAGSSAQINLGGGVTVKVIESDAQGVKLQDGVTPITGNHTVDATPPSENDYSISLKISYGKLDYYTGGDTDGEYATSSFGYSYNDIESYIAPLVGQVELYHANHHGSGHSSNQFFLNTMQPKVSFISCGSNSYGHPAQASLDRMLAVSRVYLTNLCDTTRVYGASTIVNNDIAIKSLDGVHYTVNGDAYIATDPVIPGSIVDIRINEILPAPTNGIEWVELYNPTNNEVNVGGAIIDDIANGGGAPTTLPANTLIPAKGYFSLARSNYFNNAGDDVRLLKPDGIEIDRFTYGSTSNDKSWARIPDGGNWSTTQRNTPTRGASNQ
jgi:beta-lactamase superfamily II metal-dependent hydrolase